LQAREPVPTARPALGSRLTFRTPGTIMSDQTSERGAGRSNTYGFSGQRAVVTGGAQGIGRAVADRLKASGAAVELWDLEPPDGEGFVFRRVDVTDWAAVSRAAEEARGAGGIDALVCSAGIAGPNHKTWEYPLDAWALVMRVNLDGVFHCCRAVVPLMVERGYGRIVNIASIAGKEGNPNASAYSASKAAVIALTKSLGKELAERDIAVNCVTPAAARTRIFEQISQEHIDYMLSKIPRGRFVEVEEIASMIAWLVSRENSFTTGAVFDLSGGRATY
jgi:NAD(P)-dependent dehydrogenase (short-subunit alcohol dehydrogenase family)